MPYSQRLRFCGSCGALQDTRILFLAVVSIKLLPPDDLLTNLTADRKETKNRNLLGFETCKDTAWDIGHGLLHIEEVEKVAQKTS